MRTEQDYLVAIIYLVSYQQMRSFRQPGDFFLFRRVSWQNPMKTDEQSALNVNRLGDKIKVEKARHMRPQFVRKLESISEITPPPIKHAIGHFLSQVPYTLKTRN